MLFNASKIVAALRLNIYQRHVGVVLSEGQNLRLYYAGMFLNLFLPGGIGGDGYKIFVLNRQQGVAVKKLVLVTLADRVSGLLCLLLLLCGLVPWVGLGRPALWAQSAAGISAFSIIAFFLAGHRFAAQFRSTALSQVFFYGMTVQLLQLGCTAALLAYMKLPSHHFSTYLAVFLISSIAAVLPLSFGGIGVREMTFFYCLKLLNLDPAYGVAASSAFFITTVASSVLGGAFMRNMKLERNNETT